MSYGEEGLPVATLVFSKAEMSSSTLEAKEGHCYYVSPISRPILTVVTRGLGMKRFPCVSFKFESYGEIKMEEVKQLQLAMEEKLLGMQLGMDTKLKQLQESMDEKVKLQLLENQFLE